MKKNPVGRPKRLKMAEPAETRGRMLEVAEQLLEVRGYAGVSMEEVAKQVGITKASIYHHFPDGKDALILAVGHQLLQRHEHGIREAIESTPLPRDQLKAIAKWIFSGTGKADRMLRESGTFLPPAYLAEIYQGFMSSLYNPIENIIKAGVESGDFRPHDTMFMTCTFLTLMTGFEELREIHSPTELAERLMEFVLNGIAQDKKLVSSLRFLKA